MPLYVWINSELSLIVGTMGICMQNMMTVRQKISNVCRLFFVFSKFDIRTTQISSDRTHNVRLCLGSFSFVVSLCVSFYSFIMCVEKLFLRFGFVGLHCTPMDNMGRCYFGLFLLPTDCCSFVATAVTWISEIWVYLFCFIFCRGAIHTINTESTRYTCGTARTYIQCKNNKKL